MSRATHSPPFFKEGMIVASDNLGWSTRAHQVTHSTSPSPLGEGRGEVYSLIISSITAAISSALGLEK